MPNWCWSGITIYSKNKNIVKDFHDKLDTLIKNNPLCEEAYDGDSRWLGNILVMSGFDKEKVLEHDNDLDFDYRGNIDYIENVTKQDEWYNFNIYTETAWAPMITIWKKCLEKLYQNKDIRLAYCAEEPGCKIYCKYDPDKLFYNGEEVYIEVWTEKAGEIIEKYPQLGEIGFHSDYYSLDSAKKYLQRMLRTNEDNLDRLIILCQDFREELENIDPDITFNVFKYEEYIDLEEDFRARKEFLQNVVVK